MEEAVRNGELEVVREFIRSGTDVNGSNGCSLGFSSIEGSLLHLAIAQGYKDIALALLEAGADVHAKDTVGWTALRFACFMELEEVVQALIDRGSRVNERDRLGYTPLRAQSQVNEISMCLLRAGASCEGLEQRRMNELLLHACQKRDLSAIRTLLKEGCSVSILSTEKQEALLHHACRHEDDVFVVRTLLKDGCSVSILYIKEQEELLHHACHEGDVFVVRTLLKDGCSDSILSRKEQEELLHHACREDDMFVVHTLLENGCSGKKLTQKDLRYLVHNLSEQEIEELLHHTCREGDVFVVRTLFEEGCSVSILSTEEQEKLLHHACHEGDVFVVRTLLKDGCSVSILSTEEQEELLHHACNEGDVFVVRTLLKDGCSVSILSTEEQERLLHHACREDDMFVVQTLLKNGCSVGILSTEEQEMLLHYACHENYIFVVEALLASGCDMNCVSSEYTPLMVATEKDHEEVVKKLILAGANLGMQTANSNTALHIAATRNSIQCGILLAEGGASVRTKNNFAQTPLDLASGKFKEAIKQALSFTTRKALCIIGNAESGKSTLIAALQAESNSFLGKIINRFRRVSDRRLRTTGIETVSHCSQRYGEVLFFDFAGQDDYHGPHQMFLESILSKPEVSMTLLLVVKLTEVEDAILHQLHRWLSPVALMTTPASPPHVIIIGSFLDKVESKEVATAKLTRCIEAAKRDLNELALEFVGSTFLNCRKPQSKGIDKICNFLQDIPIPEFSAAHTSYSLAWVLSQIRASFTAQAVQLQEFSTWIKDNEDNLPRTMPPPEEVCQDLSAAGHALYLPNGEDSPKSWLVLDLPGILHDVYGTLFSQYKAIVNVFGLLHRRHLAKLFSHLDLEMVQQLLISLEFCLAVDPSVLKVELSELTQSKEASGWLFFPALISAKPPQSILQGLPQQSVCNLCWQLRTAKKHSISARLLQTILLRLAAHFVVKHHNEDGVREHCCSIWWNGIAWQSNDGVGVTVHIVNNWVIHVMGTSIVSADKSCQYLADVISDILSTVLQLSPKLTARAFIVHPPPEDITAPLRKELFPVEGIRSSIRQHKQFALSLTDSENHYGMKPVTVLFGGCTPTLEDIERINWLQPEPNQTQSPPGPSQLEPNQTQSPPGPSQPEPTQTQPSAGPSQLEPNQTQPPPGPSQPEANQTQSPPVPSQSEPTQTQSAHGLNQTQPPLGPSQFEPNQTQPPLGLGQLEQNQTQPPLGLSQLERNQTQSSARPSQPDVLSQTVHTCEGYLMLFRTYVSRKSAGRGRAVLEGVGLAPETIRACYVSHPFNEEEAVQDGLIKWTEGHHGYSPTWRVLLDAMAYAGVAQQHCHGLREELYQKLKKLSTAPSQSHSSAEQSETKLHSEGNGVPTDSQTVPSGAQALLDISSNPDIEELERKLRREHFHQATSS